MFKIVLPLLILLMGCGKEIEEVPQTEEARSPDSSSIEAEVSLKSGVDRFGQIYFSEHKNDIDDLCIDIPEKITDLSGIFEENSELKLEINTSDRNGTDYVYCHYQLTDVDYTIEDCFDYQDRSLGVRKFWFIYQEKSIVFSLQKIAILKERRVQTKIKLKACGS